MPYNVSNDGISPSNRPAGKPAETEKPTRQEAPPASTAAPVFKPELDEAANDELKLKAPLFIDPDEQALTAKGFWEASDAHTDELQGADAAVGEAQKRTLKTPGDKASPFARRSGVVDAFMKAQVEPGSHELTEAEVDAILSGLNQDHSLFGIAPRPETE